MRIVESAVQQQQRSQERKVQSESLTLSGSGIQITRQQMARLERQEALSQQLEGMLQLSGEGIALAEEQPKEMVLHYSEEDKRKIELLEKFLSKLLGKPYRFQHVDRSEDEISSSEEGIASMEGVKEIDGPRPPDHAPAWGVRRRAAEPQGLRVVSRSYYEEYERMSFSSEGRVRLEDGSEISFSMNVNYERHFVSYQEQEIQIGRPKDPVVFDLTGEGLDFSGHKLRLDLDLDGTEDVVSAFKANAGILVDDVDSNGSVTSALELVGAQAGDGLFSLRAFDEDRNGWIDAGDAVLKRLKLWLVDEAGNEKLIGLEEAGIGAIYLGALESPFQFKNGLESIAQMHQSSIYLRENGKVGAVHAVDYLL